MPKRLLNTQMPNNNLGHPKCLKRTQVQEDIYENVGCKGMFLNISSIQAVSLAF